MIERLVVASKNADKVGEVTAVLGMLRVAGEIVADADWPDVEESGSTLEENALLKARAVSVHLGLHALADDTGLEVRALDGAPGVRTARFAGPDATYQENVTALLEAMEGEFDRSARFRTVVALVDPDGGEIVAEGRLDGRIAFEEKGSYGFGYDPVFEVGDRTLAQMAADEKNEMSHRRLALQALASRLSNP